MGVRILVGEYDGQATAAVMVNSPNSCAFGPLFDDWDSANEFVEWFGSPEHHAAAAGLGLPLWADPRYHNDNELRQLQTVWAEQREPQTEVLF